jgi:nucleoside-diphosphate-sugar epimerase
MTKILVTGGSGFLGKAILDELTGSDSPVKPSFIRVFDMRVDGVHPDSRVEFVRGDIRDFAAVAEACKGIDLVIHSAAIVDWGSFSFEDLYAVNVGGTENILKACTNQHVRHLVFTSSLDAIFGGKPLININESLPYPEEHPTAYCASKFLSEKAVLESNRQDFTTCALRPSDIYGEHDPYHIGSLIAMARGGFYIRLGNGRARSQHVYVRNIAHAHLLAARALLDHNQAVAGNAYLITDGEGTNFFKFFDRIVEGAGYRIRPRNLWLPRPLAMAIGAISECIAFLIRPVKRFTPKMSRFAVTYTCTDFTFSSEKAKKDFGFTPKYSEEQAFRRTVDFYRMQKQAG